MRKNIFLIKYLVLLGLLLIPISAPAANYCRMADRIVRKYLKEFSKPKGLIVTGYGGAFMYDVKIIDLDLVSFETMTVDKARVLYVEMMEEFLSRMNAHEKIRPYLHNYPFTQDNMELMIGFETPEKKITYDGHVALMFYLENKKTLYFKGYDAKKQKFYTIHTESYEEALEIVKSHTPATCLEISQPQSHSKAKRKNNKKH